MEETCNVGVQDIEPTITAITNGDQPGVLPPLGEGRGGAAGPLFCNRCHNRIIPPKFLMKGNIKTEKPITIKCGNAKCAERGGHAKFSIENKLTENSPPQPLASTQAVESLSDSNARSAPLSLGEGPGVRL